MPVRLVAAGAALLLLAAACGGSPAGTGSAATGRPTSTTSSRPPATTASPAPAGSTAAPQATSAPASAGTAIDLSNLDVCALVDMATVEALTGETGFITDQKSDASSSSCFWAVPRAFVPQYLEVQIFRRATGLSDYTVSVNGATCTDATVSAVGAEAKGGVCSGTQQKVYLVAMDQGVAVQVLVNEPIGALTPEMLADAVNGVIAALR